MLITIVAIVLLLIFLSFFVSFKINFGKKVNLQSPDMPWEVDTEVIPPSSADARYKEMRFEFLRFAEFFLLVKRPYTIGVTTDDEPGVIEGAASERGLATSIAGSSVCKDVCEQDPGCNAWKYDTSSTCTKYYINGPGQIREEATSSDKVGYIFQPDDSWAITDGSNMPTSEAVFEGVADMVLKLNPKIPALRSRAQSIKISPLVKYCYENDPSTNTTAYEEEKEIALKSLERAAIFFLFPKEDATYENKYVYALSMAALLDAMDLDSAERDIFKSAPASVLAQIKAMVQTLNDKLADYNLVRTWLKTHDSNYDGYITREELRILISKAQSGDYTLDVSDLDLSDSTWHVLGDSESCISKSDVDALIDEFFNTYDKNRDGKVSLEEMASAIFDGLDGYTPPTCAWE